MRQISRTLRTIRHLRPSQLAWRLWYNLERRRVKYLPFGGRQSGSTHVPRLRFDFPILPVFHETGLNECAQLDLLSQGVFEHLNERHEVGYDQPDWDGIAAGAGRLWAITLQYHPWAYALAHYAARESAEPRKAIQLLRHYLSRWLTDFSSAQTNSDRGFAWNSYAIATRLGWWARAHCLLNGHGKSALPDGFLESAWRQAEYLARHIEWDLRGNHLLRDAVGLAVAGRFFYEPEAKHWLETAAEVASEQATEQVLADGGHFERSPMYHLDAMEDILLLSMLIEDEEVVGRLRETWERMAEWLRWMRHPDGQIPLFNDAAFNGACEPARMFEIGAEQNLAASPQMPAGGRYFADTGMAVWHGTPWTVFFDVGPVGPDYQPGHAHADTLSFECSFRGERLIVDTGTHSYDNDERRRYDRRTLSHNTVCIDNEDSSEVWHIFRVGRRAKPVGVRADFTSSRMDVQGAHTGYDHLPGRPRHVRRILAQNDGNFLVMDRIEGKGRHRAEASLVLSPEWNAVPAAGGWVLMKDSRQVRVSIHGSQELSLRMEPHKYHPEYGSEAATVRLAWSAESDLPIETQAVLS